MSGEQQSAGVSAGPASPSLSLGSPAPLESPGFLDSPQLGGIDGAGDTIRWPAEPPPPAAPSVILGASTVNVTLPCGDTYEGEALNGRWHGTGTYTWAMNGGHYTGEWQHSYQQGRGVRTYPFGDVYDGDWKFDHREGRGVCSWANCDRYEGSWLEDIMEGAGSIVYANGDTYTGQFSAGLLSGKNCRDSPMKCSARSR